MQNIILVIELILALALIGVVLIQRSEGGGLGIGGGGGGGMGGRPPAHPLAKVTWALGVAFLISTLALTVLASRDAGRSSVIDRGGVEATAEETDTGTQTPTLPSGGSLLPPRADDAPATPPKADE